MIRRAIIITLVICAMSAGLVLAGDPPPGGYPHPWMLEKQHQGPPGQGGPGPQQFERLRMKKLMELLELDPETATSFKAAWRSHRQEQMDIRQKSREKIDLLADGLRSEEMSESEIRKLTEELQALEQARFESMQKLHSEMKQMLTYEQLAKVFIFRERFESRLLKHLGERRRQGHFPPGSPPFEPGDFPPDSIDSLNK